jgi:hypothetical protein
MMRRVLGTTLVAVGLAAAGCGNEVQQDTTRDTSGEITESGEIGAFKIQLGDCLTGSVSGQVESVEGIPCDQPHQNEVYHAFDIAEGDGAFPGDDLVQQQADEGCLAAFQGFVGLDFPSSVYEISTLVPTEQSWGSLDDREVLCLLGQPVGTLTTGTAAGTAI